ncbi:polysaccharide lyase [Streptomyces sp. NPDC048639]|uniref:polysaccharide lyase n=1 Tax=Streptomyces sp. NPDC048639 TaxID=3365581 RepID=UPI00371B9BE8
MTLRRHMKKLLTLGAAATLAAGVVATAGAAEPSLILDWESEGQRTLPDAAPPDWAKEYDPSIRHDNGEPQARVAKAPDPVRAGEYSSRFELRKDDPAINGGTRSELSGDFLDGEQWYGFSTYLKDWDPDQASDIVTQWHQHWDVGSSPPLSINTRKGHWEISQNREDHQEQTDLGAYETNKWTDWVIHVKWSSGDDGVLQIWKDGKPVEGFEDRKGPNTYNDDRGNYMKIGIYKWPWSQGKPSDTDRRVLFHDEVRVMGEDGSYEAVAPAGGTPPPAADKPSSGKPSSADKASADKTASGATAAGR